jgi:hypothetical protein
MCVYIYRHISIRIYIQFSYEIDPQGFVTDEEVAVVERVPDGAGAWRWGAQRTARIVQVCSQKSIYS